MQDDFLSRCVVDPVARKFYLYSEQGDERVVDCETMEQFMSVLELVRDKCDDDVLTQPRPATDIHSFVSPSAAAIKTRTHVRCPHQVA